MRSKSSTRTGVKDGLSDFECNIVLFARQAGLNISVSTHRLGFSPHSHLCFIAQDHTCCQLRTDEMMWDDEIFCCCNINAPCHKVQTISVTVSSLHTNGLHSHTSSIEHLQVAVMCRQQIRSNCVMLSCKHGPKSQRNISCTMLNLSNKELKHFWVL